MEIIYKNKKSKEDIEKEIEKYKNIDMPIDNKNTFGIFIKDDNFRAMSKLLKKFEGKVDLVYIDPPYNTNSTFYYDEEKISTVSSTTNTNIAYKDNLNFESYLEFMRERIILIHKLLSDKGTLYLHIDIKVGHYIKILLDEIFGKENFLNDITRIKSNPKNFSRKAFGNQKDVIYVYSKVPKKNIFNNINYFLDEEKIEEKFPKIDKNGRRYTTVPCHAPGETKNGETGREWKGVLPPKGRHWRYAPKELEEFDKKNLIEWSKNGIPRIINYADDHKGEKIQDVWLDYKDPQYPSYPTQKPFEMLEMIIQQSSNEDSIIMDCFAGSAIFLEVGLKYNRFVIGIDQSEITYKLLLKNKIFEKIQIIDNNFLLKRENLKEKSIEQFAMF